MNFRVLIFAIAFVLAVVFLTDMFVYMIAKAPHASTFSRKLWYVGILSAMYVTYMVIEYFK